jgi:GT2 family glycosyltransferase
MGKFLSPICSPLIRIVILNFNQTRCTLNLVENLAFQDYKNFDVVVVDNCSIEKEYFELRDSLPKTIKIIHSLENLGYAKGNNLGCRFEIGNSPDYYMILNNDLIIDDPELIKKLLYSLSNKEHKNSIAVSPLVNTVTSKTPIEGQIQVRKILPLMEQIIVNSSLLKKIFKNIFYEYIYKSDMPYLNKELVVDTINGAAFLINGNFFREIGFMDEGTFLYNEEIILGKIIKSKGFTCLLNGYTILKHLQGVSTKSTLQHFNFKMRREMVVSEIYYYRQYFGINRFALSLIYSMRMLELYIIRIYRKMIEFFLL